LSASGGHWLLQVSLYVSQVVRNVSHCGLQARIDALWVDLVIFVHEAVSQPGASGYLHGKRRRENVDPRELRERVEVVTRRRMACLRNQVKLMSIMRPMMRSRYRSTRTSSVGLAT
jgi:hypothetical protein